MKKLLTFLFVITTIVCYSQSGSYGPPANAPYISPYSGSSNYIYQAPQPDYSISVAVSDDNYRVKVKYELKYGQVCINCGLRVWNGTNWIVSFGGSDDYGSYVYYMGKQYYF